MAALRTVVEAGADQVEERERGEREDGVWPERIHRPHSEMGFLLRVS